MALLPAVVSIYALLAFMVTRRTREIGIRVGLGARRSQVLATVAGFQSVMLIRMPAVGVMTPTIVIGALALARLAAAWVPTRRALGIRPSEALANE